MRLGFSLRLTASRGRPTLALVAAAVAAIARRWADADTWIDNLTWSDAE